MRTPSIAAIFVLTVACSGPVPSGANPTPGVFVPQDAARSVNGGCGATQAYLEGLPDDLLAATRNKPPRTPYAVAHPPTAAVFLFSSPLHVKGSEVWVVASPPRTDLVIEQRSIGTTAPYFQQTLHPDSTGGYSYPGVIVGQGCSEFVLKWNDQVAEIELEFGW